MTFGTQFQGLGYLREFHYYELMTLFGTSAKDTANLKKATEPNKTIKS